MKNTPKAVHQRRTRFVKEFLIDQNATKAAIRAGYSEKTARVQGCELLTIPDIKDAIEAANAKVNEKLDITVERVKLELARLAFNDPGAYWNPDGSAKPFSELDEDARRAVAGFEMAELFEGKGDDRSLCGYVKKFKLADKGANLERLGRHLQMFPTKVEFSGKIEIQEIEDGDLQRQIDEIMRRIGLEGEVNAATEAGITQAGASPTNGHAQDHELIPGNGAAKT